MCLKTNFERRGLGFVEATRDVFAFVHPFGFRELSSEETIVRYASDRVFLNIYHGRSSYELGLEVGRIESGDGARRHSMSALMRARNPEHAAQYRNRIATTREEVREGLGMLARDLNTYGEQALRGDSAFFALLEQQQRKWAEEYAADIEYQRVLPRANEAFRRHDYKLAAQLYESVRAKLSPAELKKLEYASRHK